MSGRRRKQAPALQVGERIRLTPGGQVLIVVRTTPDAAHVGRKVVGKPFDAWDAEARAYKTVPGIAKMVTEAISLHAFVERVSGEEGGGDGEG